MSRSNPWSLHRHVGRFICKQWGAPHVFVSLLTCNHCQGHVPADCPSAQVDSTAVLPRITWPHCRQMKGEASAAQILGDLPFLQVSLCQVAPASCHRVGPRGTGKVAQGALQVSCRASCSIDYGVAWATKTCARESEDNVGWWMEKAPQGGDCPGK